MKLKICTECDNEKVIWKAVGKTDKYCKECWYRIKKPKGINKIKPSNFLKLDDYSKKRVAFLALHNHCKAKLVTCTGLASEIHHSKGRISENFLCIDTWVPICRNCHDYLENNPLIAKELGLSSSRLQ